MTTGIIPLLCMYRSMKYHHHWTLVEADDDLLKTEVKEGIEKFRKNAADEQTMGRFTVKIIVMIHF